MKWENAEDDCRGGICATQAQQDAVCKGRDELVDELQHQGWCYGEN